MLLSVGGSFVGGFPLPGGILVFTASIYSFFVIGCGGKSKWFKKAGVYSMIFKVPGGSGTLQHAHSPWGHPHHQWTAAQLGVEEAGVAAAEEFPKLPPSVSFFTFSV